MTHSTSLVQMIRDSVKPESNPAVLISGGIDSTMLLHHLREKFSGEIHTYTAGLEEENEFSYAEKVASHYGAKHENIVLKNLMQKFAELQKSLDRPRWNLWPYWCYRAANRDGCENAYIGEGLDEHFGGYWYKPRVTYQEYWGGVLEWSLPTHRQLALLFGLNLHAPFIRLDIKQTLPLWDGRCHNKTYLRELYRGIIPDFVIERRKNPGRLNFLNIWESEVEPYIGEPKPGNMERAYSMINRWVTERWLESHA